MNNIPNNQWTDNNISENTQNRIQSNPY